MKWNGITGNFFCKHAVYLSLTLSIYMEMCCFISGNVRPGMLWLWSFCLWSPNYKFPFLLRCIRYKSMQ